MRSNKLLPYLDYVVPNINHIMLNDLLYIIEIIYKLQYIIPSIRVGSDMDIMRHLKYCSTIPEHILQLKIIMRSDAHEKVVKLLLQDPK